jgi:hypothetical protein
VLFVNLHRNSALFPPCWLQSFRKGREGHWLCETNQIHVHNSPLGRDINECHFYGECHTHWTPICWLYPLYPLFLVAIFKIPPIIIFNIAKVLLTWCHAIILNQSIKELWEIAFFFNKICIKHEIGGIIFRWFFTFYEKKVKVIWKANIVEFLD